MGQAVSPFEALGRRKTGGDEGGGLRVAPLPRPGHACSCPWGKRLPRHSSSSPLGAVQVTVRGKQAIGTFSDPRQADQRSQQPQLSLEV